VADPITITAASLVAKAAQDVVGEATKSAWAGLGRLVRLVREKLKSASSGEEALSLVEAEPSDPNHISDLISVLDPLVCGDPEFYQALVALISDLSKHQAIGRFVTEIHDQARVGKVVNIDTIHGDVSFLCPIQTNIPT
jgi:gamma-glutamyl phosphate reductase